MVKNKNNKKLREFSKRLAREAAERGFFISCTFELTYKCNLRCIHCFNEGLKISELNFRQVCRIIDKLLDQGCLYFLFTGGEPFLREDFLDIYLYTKRKGGIITIYTNGTLIDNSALKIFEKYPPRKIEISIYGAETSTHDFVTRVSGSYEAVRKVIYKLKAMNINFSLKTMVMTVNKKEFWKIKKFAEKLGVGFRYDPVILPQRSGRDFNLVYRLAPEEFFKEIEIKDKERMDTYLKKWQRLDKYRAPNSTIYTCSGGRWSCSVDPEGKIKPCIFNSSGYDLLKGTMKEARSFLWSIVDQEWDGDVECRYCKIPPLCGNCPGKAELVKGDPQARIEYLCELGYLRARYLGIIEM